MIPRRLADARVSGLLFFALFTIVVFFGYLRAEYPLGTDTLGMPTDILSFQIAGDFFSTWRWYTSLGHLNFPSPVMGTIYMILGGILGLGPLDICKILFASSFFMAGYFAYLLCLDLKAKPLPSIIGGIIFCFNQVFLSQIMEGHFNMAFGCSLIPLLFLFLIRCLNSHSYLSALGLGLTAFVYGSVASPNMVLIAAVVVPLFCVPYLFPLSWSTFRTAFISVTVMAIMVFQTVLFKFTDSGNSNLATSYNLSQALFYSYKDPVQALLIKSLENSYVDSSWLGGWVFPSQLEFIAYIASLAIPAAAICYIWTRRRDRLVVGTALVLVFSVIISMGPNWVLGGLFTWGFFHIPYMDSMRVYSRFGMVIALCYTILIPLFLSSLSSHKRYQFTMPWMKNQVIDSRHLRTAAVIILAGAIVLPSSGALFGMVGSFDLPDSYAQPYEYLKGSGDGYRYLNLPYGFLYYGTDVPRFDGYPSSVTLDPGVYSPLLTKDAFAFGLESEDFWNTVKRAMDERWFGYRDSMELVGAAGNVKYVVAQIYSDQKERETFLLMNGINQTIYFTGGSQILVNDAAMPRAYAVSSMMVTTGGYRSLYSAMGSGLLDPSRSVMAFLGQEEQVNKERLLEEADGIVLIDGDTFQFMCEYIDWGTMLHHLSEQVDIHNEDPLSSWIVRSYEKQNGLTWSASAYTHSDIPMTIGMDAGNNRHVYVQAAKGPDSGNVSFLYSGENRTFNLTSAAYSSTWLDLGIIPDNTTSIEVAPEGNGEVSLMDMLIAPETQLEKARQSAEDALTRYKDKVIFIYPTYQEDLSDGWFINESDLGFGASNTLSWKVNKYTGPQGQLTFGLGGHGDLLAGQEYNLTIELSTPYREVPCTLEVYSGKSLIASKTVLVSPGDVNLANMTFQLPQGTTDVSLAVWTGSDQIQVGAVKVTPTVNLPLGVNIDYPYDSSVVVKIMRSEEFNDTFSSISINGKMAPIETIGGNITTTGNLVRGDNQLSLNISQAYALVIQPSNWSAGHGSVPSTFHQISTASGSIDLDVNGTAYIILSENYDKLWNCSGDALGFRAFGLVNGYIVTGMGVQHHDLVFNGGEIYGDILVRYFLFSLIAIVALVAFPIPMALVRRMLTIRR